MFEPDPKPEGGGTEYLFWAGSGTSTLYTCAIQIILYLHFTKDETEALWG